MSNKISLKTPLSLEALKTLKSGDQVLLSGVIIMARDAAHVRFLEELQKGKPLPFETEGQVIYYAAPTLAKPGHVIGSCGPTTASRMDPFTVPLIERGLKGMIGKGKRSPEILQAMMQYGCVYFGSIEGTAALIAHKVQSLEVIAYPELGAEAVARLQVLEMPLTIINDLYGGDLYEEGRKTYRNN